VSKKKKRKSVKYRDVELNIMPFIDVFSLLNTFLLMSAVFLSIGVLEVQIPFLSSAPPDTKDTERVFDVKVDVEKERIEVTTSWSKPPVNEEVKRFDLTKAGAAELHKHMVNIRKANPDTDKVSLFTEDDVIWKEVAMVIDAIKSRLPGDPIIAPKNASDIEKAIAAEFVYPKVVMSSVML
jgi:biopolymer transport protein ExbD